MLAARGSLLPLHLSLFRIPPLEPLFLLIRLRLYPRRNSNGISSRWRATSAGSCCDGLASKALSLSMSFMGPQSQQQQENVSISTQVAQQDFIFMTTAETDETVECGRQEVGSIIIRDGGEKEGNKNPSFTTLSTIAIQAGRSQIVISILKSGSLVHLQLVQVHPGLCEIGLSKAENQTLIQEQQQLIEKLKKYEREVLAVVERSRQTEMKKRDEGMMEQKKSIKTKKEEVVNKAMAASLSEGWSLLLHLLERRQEVLTLASDFYNRTQEFNTSIDRMEDLRIRPDHKQLGEIQVIYGSMRKELLEKSLQVLSSSSVLLHKLRQLQKTEALQRRGAVMEDKEQEDEGSQCSTGVILKLEELVEKLHDRRRKLDQAAMLQIQLVESSIKYCKEEGSLRQSSYMNWSPDKFPYQTWQSGSTPAEMSDLATHSRTKDLHPGSRSGEAAVLDSGYKSKELQHEPALNTQSDSTLKQVSDQQPDSILNETKDQKPRSKSDRTRNLLFESRSEVNNDMQCKYASAESKGLLLKLQSVPRTQETRTFESVTRSFLKPGSRKNVQSTSGSYLNPGSSSEGGRQQVRSKSEETGHFQSGSPSVLKKGFKSYVKPGSRSEAADVSFSELSRKDETKQHREVTSRQVAGQESMMGKETQSGVHTHQTFLTNQRQQLLLSCQQLMDKVWSWVQQGNRVLSYSCEVGRQLPEAEDSLNTHLQLHTQAQSADHDAEKLRQILDQIRALQTDQVTRTSHYCPSEANRQLSPLKALTEQLKRGITGKQTRSRSTWSGPEVVDAPCTISPELAGGVEVVLSELQSLNRKIDANLQLLQPYISFLRKAQQVEQEMEELREIYRRKPEKEEESQVSCSDIGSPQKKKEEMLQTFLTAQYLGNDYVHTVTMVSGSGLNLLSLVSVVQQTMERLRRTQQEVNKMQSFQQIQIQYQQEDMKYCKKYQERLFKNQQDLKCVSELLDSCTLMDLGSDLQTSSLLERFSQARPHFIQLDAEVEYMEKSWETVRAVQDRLKAKALMGRTMGDEDLSELLKLHKRVNDKIQQTELILELSSSFHLTSKQRAALIQVCQKASALKTEISTAVSHSGRTCFKVKQLETRLLTLDSLSSTWLNEAARHEEKLVSDHIHWILDSFKDLKKHFRNMKFNYLKGNDQTRNMRAVRNQLQQVDLYEDKLQVLRKHLQAVMSLLGLEVKDGGVAREVDAINELQRQMSEFERSVSQHQKSLEMTCRLQQSIEEYQLWSEEAIATITRVGKFAMECRSTDAITVLHHQFEKFVWPTVPQQQERISQFTELAVRLHGDLKQQQNDGRKELTEKEKIEQRIEKETRGAEERQKKLREDRKIKKREQTDNRSTQEAVDMYKLKKMGHTPELIPNHNGKEVPMKRQTANKGKPHLQKNPGEVDGLTNASKSSPTETIQHVYPIPATLLSSVIGPSFSDIQREFQGKDKHETGMQEESVAGWTEVELQQQEEMTEDSLSNNEYESPSPDDISLPPLADTPESSMVQSDIEEGICFSSQSIHSSQYHAQLEHSETDIVKGVVQQQTRQKKNGPSPPTSFQSNTRSESSSFVQNPLTVPAPSTLTSTLYRILRTGETTTACFPRGDGLFMGNTELSFNSHPVHKSNTAHKLNSGLHEARAPPQHSGLLKPYAAFPQTSTIVSKSRNLPQPCKDSSIGHDQGVPFFLTGKGTTSSSMPSTLATSTIVTQQTVYCQSFPAERTFACPKASSTIRTKQESPSSSGCEYLADVHWPVLPEPSHISSIKTPNSTITSSDKLSTRQSDQTVHSLHESLTSMCTQQYVHGLGISTSSPPKPAPSPQLKTEAHAFVQQAKLHVTPVQQPSSPLHLLTPEQDPDICQTMAIVEEIKLTPQIQGPPVPAPPSFISMGQTESLPQG
ncbi:hypothetical protein Q8A73_009504 [Channa argus]|nr:hypothetical protein Q8A73_009504 [Channa argus]